MKVFIINGLPKSGKTTFENLVVDELKKINDAEKVGYDCRILSTITPIKEVAEGLGWNPEDKSSEARKFLSELKKLSIEFNDYPTKYICNAIDSITHKYRAFDIKTDDVIIFIDCRESKEIDKLLDKLGAIPNCKTYTVLIDKEECKKDTQSNMSDSLVYCRHYNYIVTNNGTIEDLRKDAKKFIEMAVLEKPEVEETEPTEEKFDIDEAFGQLLVGIVEALFGKEFLKEFAEELQKGKLKIND